MKKFNNLKAQKVWELAEEVERKAFENHNRLDFTEEVTYASGLRVLADDIEAGLEDWKIKKYKER